MKDNLIYPELSYEITGLLFKTHNDLGRYCKEKQYGDYLEELFKKNGIKHEREKVIPKSFEGEGANRNRIDFLVEGRLVIEIKCKRVVDRSDFYQLKRYLVALNKKPGLIVNFHEKYLKPKRILNPNYS